MTKQKPGKFIGFTVAVVTLVCSTMVVAAEHSSDGIPNASPGEIFLRYNAVLADMDSLEALIPYWATPEAKLRKSLASMSADRREQLMTRFEQSILENVVVIDQAVRGDTARVLVRGRKYAQRTGKMENVTGAFFLRRARGGWKITNRHYFVFSHGMRDASPGDVYLRLNSVIAGMDSLRDVLPYAAFDLRDLHRRWSSYSDSERVRLLQKVKGYVLQEPRVVGENIDGDRATIVVRGWIRGPSGETEEIRGVVQMGILAGEWKTADLLELNQNLIDY